MCGIIGCKKEDAVHGVIDGLKRLEYRGYDSWGISLEKEGNLFILKKAGKIGDFSREDTLPKSEIAIGHTRWATHGKVSEQNSHPHVDCQGRIAVVHNGIIENFCDLKDKLEKLGHHFNSETDTEVIPHLIEEHMKNKDFEESCIGAIKEIEGSYALLIQTGKKLAFASKENPLIIGIGEGEINIASDISAFGKNISKAIFMENGEMGIIVDNIKFFDLQTGKKIEKKSVNICSINNMGGKGDFQHFMIKEIYDQEQSIRETIKQDKNAVRAIAKKLKDSKELLFIACGTAYHAAMVGSYLFAKIARMRSRVVLASEFEFYKELIDEKTIIIPVSQSGETADVLSAVKSAKENHGKVISIINVPTSSLGRISDDFLLTKAGKEVAVASTKAFTSQICLLAMLAYECAGKGEEGNRLLSEIPDKINQVLSEENLRKIKELSFLAKKDNLFIIGRAINYPIALEAALKIKEVSYVHAEGFAGGELKHGTLALIEEDTPCLEIGRAHV